MKYLFSVALLLFSYQGLAQGSDIEARLAALEQKVEYLQSESITDCQMGYKYHGTYLNDCPKYTVIKDVFLISSGGPIQVECYYYQLSCKKGGRVEQFSMDNLPK